MDESNLIFIGDNLTVMNNKEFRSKVPCVDTIYIDPPYNTRSKFSYIDKRSNDEWAEFMKVRLECAKTLLKETGVIFISIDDNEYAYLKVLCDNIFGINNFLGSFITFQSQRSNAKYINTVHEYVLCYAKNKYKTSPFKIKRIFIPEDAQMINYITTKIKKIFLKEGISTAQDRLKKMIKKYCFEKNITWLKNYCNIDSEGNVYFAKDLSTPGIPRKVNIEEIGLKLDALPTRGWSSDEKFKKLHKENRLVFKNNRPYEKHLLVDSEDNVSSFLNFYSRQGKHDLNKLGLRDLFDTPKPVELIKHLIRISTPNNGIVLDFFAGSGTTGQAVLEINAEDLTNIKFVLIQKEEKIDKTTKSFEVCHKIGIPPFISEILLYRIKVFADMFKIKSNIVVERVHYKN
jgi:adenine-specific DNA-methyltransferase